MKARIYLAGDMLMAHLEDGRLLSHMDARRLADLLWKSGVTAAEVTMIDWHEDAEHAPLAGQRVAIYARLRIYERSAK